jgi:dTDP-4-dehydrorhamnose reductase
MKILVTGANGQLGTDLVKALKHHEVVALTHADVDITDFAAVKEASFKHRPDVIVNTASYVRVDDCETNQDLAYRVNALGARNMAVAAEELGAKLVHLSTDYVFGGEGERSESLSGLPLKKGEGESLTISPQLGPVAASWKGEKNERKTPYTEFDTPVPLNAYGKSKLAGEEFVRHLCRRYFIVRASGLFGVAGSSGKGGNFVETILRLAKERDKLTVVNDQVFSPTYTPDLAAKIVQLLETEMYGIYHITNSGACSWYDFATEILRLAGSRTPVLPITSAQYPQRAKRPAYSVLDHYHLRLLGMDDLRSWQEGLGEYMYVRKRESV